jgi:secreted PhoX family phosphatase
MKKKVVFYDDDDDVGDTHSWKFISH